VSTDKDDRNGLRRFRLDLEYDGTDFAGFQLQGQNNRTVQGVLEIALAKATGQTVRVHGAGRTDAGVHATGQVAHFDAVWPIPEERIVPALLGVSPRDLAVKSGCIAPGFHARFDASARVYRYTILNRFAPSALLGRFALYERDPLDVQAMQAASVHLTGHHDFGAFGLPHAPGKSTVRWVWQVKTLRVKDTIQITVRGNAFLKHMVRAFVGTLLEVGRGHIRPETVRVLRENRDREKVVIAPALGLCLVRVEYGGERYESGANEPGEVE
jgi:tRNA pseudouridine38-40 synthase